LLKKNRVALAEEVAKDICIEVNYYRKGGVLNSHWVTPIQNKIAPRIGIDEVPDPNGSLPANSKDEYERFMKYYTSQYILRSINGAVNDSSRLINYHDFVEYLETQRPADVDSYEFLNHFVFDMDTGKFRDDALKFALCKMKILRIGTDKDPAPVVPVPVPVPESVPVAPPLPIVEHVLNVRRTSAPVVFQKPVPAAQEMDPAISEEAKLGQEFPITEAMPIIDMGYPMDIEVDEILRESRPVPKKKSIFSRVWGKITKHK